MFSSTQMLSIFLLSLTAIILLTTKMWILMWIFLEMSTMAFILFMKMKIKQEMLLTFFIFQVLPSIILMVTLFNASWTWDQSNEMTIFFILVSMFMKIGAFPFNTWMMKFNSKMKWMTMNMLLTWQKIIPIIILMKWSIKHNTIFLLSLCLIIMCLILAKSMNMKILVSLSSIIHNMWMMMPIFFIKVFSLIYLTAYSLIVTLVNMFFNKMNISKFINQSLSKNYFIAVLTKMCSLAGIPPTMGFLLKMMALSSILLYLSYSLLVIINLVVGATISFFVYSQMMMKNSMTFKSQTLKNMISLKNKLMVLFFFSVMTPMGILMI